MVHDTAGEMETHDTTGANRTYCMTVCRHGKGKGSQVNNRMMMLVSRRAYLPINSRQAVQAVIIRLSALRTRET